MGLDLEEQKERERATGRLPASQAGVVHRLAGSDGMLELGTGIKQPEGEGMLGRGGLWDPREMWSHDRRWPQQVFCCRAKVETGELGLEKRVMRIFG